jgi:hypothetical protein
VSAPQKKVAAASPKVAFAKGPLLVQWLTLVVGLSLVTVEKFDRPSLVVPLWFGAVVGTALGQVMSVARMRMWIAGVFLFMITTVGAAAGAPLWMTLGLETWQCTQAYSLAVIPAVICGYFALSERSGLAAFWFPAVLWMAPLAHPSGELIGLEGWVVLGGLVALLLGFLRARETRRAALWRTATVTRGATPDLALPSILRRDPARFVAHAVWLGGAFAGVLTMTGLVAPWFWKTDVKTTDGQSPVAAAAGSDHVATGAECCEDGSVTQQEVQEYLPLFQWESRGLPAGSCVACRYGQPISGRVPDRYPSYSSSSAPGSQASTTTTTTNPSNPVAAANPSDATNPNPYLADSPSRAATTAPVALPVPPPIVASPVAVAPVAPIRPIVVAADSPRAPAVGGPRIAPGPAYSRAPESPLSATPFLVFALAMLFGVGAQYAIRPVRRAWLLRHLRDPMWPETIDQRVSNLWQLALIGLRDAGWETLPGEQPSRFAARIGVAGLATCAEVLERARHGVRVDAEDLDAMSTAARAIYTEARAQTSSVARLASEVRWPLV